MICDAHHSFALRVTSEWRQEMEVVTMDRLSARHSPFTTWCQCTRLLLGWSVGTHAGWRKLYAAGATPLQAARWTIFGEQGTVLD